MREENVAYEVAGERIALERPGSKTVQERDGCLAITSPLEHLN